jgi:hypothetical protein
MLLHVLAAAVSTAAIQLPDLRRSLAPIAASVAIAASPLSASALTPSGGSDWTVPELRQRIHQGVVIKVRPPFSLLADGARNHSQNLPALA